MKQLPKFSFLLPAYKVKYLEEALKGIKNQSHSDFLVIVSDDCSPDDIKSIFDSVVGDDPRFSYRRNEKNMGGTNLVAHWNLLVEMCETEFFIMASDDDVYDSNFLEQISNLTNAYPEVDLFRSRVKKINFQGEIVYEEGPYKESLSSIEYIAQNYNNTAVHCLAQFVLRTNVFKSKGMYPSFPKALFADDASAILMSEHGCINTKDVLFSFRLSNESISSSEYNQEKTKELVAATLQYDTWFKQYMRGIRANSKSEQMLIDFIWYQHRMVVSSFFSWSVNCKWRDFWNLCRLAKTHGIQTLSCKVAFLKNRMHFS